MTDIDIPDGYYLLREDVTNPSPDRRKKAHVVPQPVWPKGLKIEVRRFPHISPRPEFRLFGGTEKFDFYEGQVTAILPFLDPAPPVLGQVLDYAYGRVSGGSVLMFLLEQGVLTLEQIKSATKDYMEISDEAYANLQKKHWLD